MRRTYRNPGRLRRCTATPRASARAAFGLLTVLLYAAAEAQQPVTPLEIADAVGAVQFHVQGQIAAITPDGRHVAYTACDPRRAIEDTARVSLREMATRGAPHRSYGCSVHVIGAAGGSAREVLAGPDNSWSPAWSPDGTRLAFYADRGGEPRLWLWDASSGESRLLTDAPTRTRFGLEVPGWTPDGTRIVVKLRPDGMTDAELEPAAAVAGQAEPDREPGSTVTVFRSPRAEAGPSDAAPPIRARFLADLAVVDVASGSVDRIVRRVATVDFWVSPDGRHVAYLDVRERGQMDGALTQTLGVVSLSDGSRRDLADGVSQIWNGAVSWSPDGRALAYTSSPRDTAGDARSTSPSADRGPGPLYIVDVDDGTIREFAGSFTTDYLGPLWDEGGQHVYVVGTQPRRAVWRASVASGRIEPLAAEAAFEVQEIVRGWDRYRIWSADRGRSLVVTTRDPATQRGGFSRIDTRTGGATRLVEEDRSYGRMFSTPVGSADGRTVVYSVASAWESPDLWISGPDFATPRRLTVLNPRLERYVFGHSRLIEYRSAHNEPLRASLLLPAGYREGERYPLVVWVYASGTGSLAVNTFGLVGYPAYNLQMLATRGYAVLWPDVPVSRGTPMRDVMNSVMPAIDRVVELGIADPDRLAVTGQSNGGYSTLSLLVQTNRFAAAVMNAGFGNLTSFYGTMTADGSGSWIPWLERLGGAMGAPPWEAPLRYIENSPVFYLDRVETPLIIQAGTEDVSIIRHSDEVWVGLQRLGKDVTYLRYGGEGHTLAGYSNLTDYWRRVIAFFEQHLGSGGTATASNR